MAAPVAKYLGGQAGAFVSDMVSGSAGQFAGEFAQRLTSGVVSQRIRMAVYNQGKLDYASIAADAFGNALGESIVRETARSSATETALRAVSGLDPNASPLHAKLAAISGDTSLSPAQRIQQINALIDGSSPQELADAFPVPTEDAGRAPPSAGRNALYEGDQGRLMKAGGLATSLQGSYAAERSSAVKQLSAVLDAMRAGYAERQQREDRLFADEPAFNRAMIFLGAASSHAVEGVKALAGLLWSGGNAAANGAAFMASQAIGVTRDIMNGDLDALAARAHGAVEGLQAFGEDVRNKLEGLKAIASFASNKEVATQLGGFLKGMAADTTATGWLLGGARFLGELAIAAATGGAASAGTLAGAAGGALLPTGFSTWSRGTLSFDAALERFGQLAFHYRSAGEALQVMAQVSGRVSDDVLLAAHQLAQAAPMAERSGILYGHIRMAEQGWQRVADFKLPGNQGLDAAYVKVGENGVREYAVLEAKSGRPSVRALGEASGAQQGTQEYIRDRLAALLRLQHLPGHTQDLAREFRAASQAETLRSFLSFADQGRSGARLYELPGSEINTLRRLPQVPWKNAFGDI
jgi:hypothetical protein